MREYTGLQLLIRPLCYQDFKKSRRLLRLPNLQQATPSEVAEAVISWLKREQSWLLVFDNLDDIEVIKGLLPENAPKKHTLITTRNPNTIGIPAEPLQVPLLDMEESMELLSTLSNIVISSDSEERKQAEAIIRELEYLPLAIEQAAAYVREVTGDFATYRNEYAKNRKELLQWTSEGNRTYPHSVATTWSMSFKIIQDSHAQAAELLQLLSFLNPDGILIEFLESGANALENDLQEIILNRSKRAKALLTLEKFSLIKWDRMAQIVLIHRLVQTVIRDDMSETKLMTLHATIIDLCDRAFPLTVTNETRRICRIYQAQILGPLLQIKMLSIKKFAIISERVGSFLRDDGKFNDSERILQLTVNTWMMISGIDHFSTLSALGSLALTYQAQGKNADAAKIQEEVLEKSREDFRRGTSPHAQHHACARFNISSSGEKCGCGQDSGGSVGEEEEDFGRRTSRHAQHHACARFDISSSGEKCGCGQDSGGSVGEEQGGFWERNIPTRSTPCIISLRHIKLRGEMRMRPRFRRKCWRRRGGFWERNIPTRSTPCMRSL